MTESMIIGGREFPMTGRTYVMGILNVTPDSFSDGGSFHRLDDALRHTERMIREGADIIDIGGESTRPGHTAVSWEEEAGRVIPVIRVVKERFCIPVSVDTWKSRVAEEAVRAGADMLNDIWGFRQDEGMAELAARRRLPVCVMHNRREPVYRDFLNDVCSDLEESLSIAQRAGLPRELLILDPGIGFGKTCEMNLFMLRNMDCLARFELPLLLGVSRKSVIGGTLDLPVDEREEGTIALSVLAAVKGYHFVRVHDVGKNVRALKMAEAVLHAKPV